MPKIVKEQTGEAAVIIKETFIDEAAATAEDGTPETTDVEVVDLKIENTKWRREYDK